MSIDPDLAGGRLTIDLNALIENWSKMRDHAFPADCGAVVKANGYGCEVEPVVKALSRAGCRVFFVALPTEGLRVRSVAPEATIFVLNGVFDNSQQAFLDGDLTPVLGTVENVRRWIAVAQQQGKAMPCALHIDSGMNRLGFQAGDFETLVHDANVMGQLDVKLLMTHFACADDIGHPKTIAQRELFDKTTRLLPGVPRSAANSAGTWQDKANIFDLARPGTVIYGAEALNDVPNPMLPVVTLEGRIIQIRNSPKGEQVGYGATQTLQRDTSIAYVSVGYADGYQRASSNTGVPLRSVIEKPSRAAFKGHFLSGIGRISMDMCGFDVTDIPPEEIAEGDWIELFGPTIPLDEVAAAAGTIGYELLVGMGQRYARTYIGAE